MKRLPALTLLLVCAISAQKQLPKKPKLVLAIAVDPFRYEYLLRFRPDYTAGFKKSSKTAPSSTMPNTNMT